MTSTDLDTLLEMGFDKPRAELAMQKKGDCESPFAINVACEVYQYDITLTFQHSDSSSWVAGRGGRQVIRRNHRSRGQGRDRPQHNASRLEAGRRSKVARVRRMWQEA